MRVAVAAAGIALVLFATGCADRAAGPATPQVFTSTENKLPRGFPPDFPLPGDWQVVYSRAEATAVSAFFRTQLSSAAVDELLRKQLPAKGWTLVRCTSQRAVAGQVQEIVATNSGVLGTIDIGGGAQVSAAVNEPYSFTVTLVRLTAAAPTGDGCT